MHHPGQITLALLLALFMLAFVAAACGRADSRPASYPTPPIADVSADANPQASADAAPDVTSDPAPSTSEADTPSAESPGDDAASEPASADPPRDEPQPDAEPEPEPEPDPWASRRSDLLVELTDPVDVDLLRKFGRIVGERRGLELIDEVPVYLIRRADIGTYFTSLYDEADIEQAEFAEAIYRLLRIIDPELNYLTLLEDLFTGLVLGLYDEEVGAFIIVSENDHISRRDLDTIAHEFVHALQDQHFDIEAGFESTNGSTDANSAYRFVLEGDARLSESLFNDLIRDFAVGLDRTLDRLPGASSVPSILRRIFNAPYLVGVGAVSRIISLDGPNAIDPYLLDPPVSTEQLLHPDKLASQEPPLDVAAPDLVAALGSDWTWIGSDTLGEYVLRATLEEGVGRSSATEAGAGWGGDRLSVYRHENGEELLAWNLRWDSAAEAEEFQLTAERWTRTVYGGSEERTSEGAFRLSGDATNVWLMTTGDSTWLLIGGAADTLDRATASMLSLTRDEHGVANSAALGY